MKDIMGGTALVARFGGDAELTGQLIALFVEEYPNMLRALRESIDGGCADHVERAAHAFKGAVANFTDGGAVTAAQALERLGREGTLAGAPAVLASLEREVDDLLDVMRQQ